MCSHNSSTRPVHEASPILYVPKTAITATTYNSLTFSQSNLNFSRSSLNVTSSSMSLTRTSRELTRSRNSKELNALTTRSSGGTPELAGRSGGVGKGLPDVAWTNTSIVERQGVTDCSRTMFFLTGYVPFPHVSFGNAVC